MTKQTATKTIVFTAMLAAIGYALSFLEFPIFPAASFLELDFSNLTTMLGGFLFGPISAIVIEIIKQSLRLITSSSQGVGELANICVASAYVIVPSILYHFKRKLRWAAIGLSIGCVMQIIAGLVVNKFITFPFYGALGFFGDASVDDVFSVMYPFIIAFNAIKSVSVSILTLAIYKRLSLALKWLFKENKTVANSSNRVYNNLMEKLRITNGASETMALAKEVASGFKGGEVVLLSGDLGAGKTVFAKGVAEALGVKADVKSPTFTLCCEYDGTKMHLVHIDAYRLKNGEEAEASGLNERFGAKGVVTLIEWPEQIESVIPKNTIKVDIKRIDDDTREISVKC